MNHNQEDTIIGKYMNHNQEVKDVERTDADAETVVDIKELSTASQRAIGRFKGWLKKHLKEDLSNLRIMTDLGYSQILFENGEMIALPLKFQIKTDGWDRYYDIEYTFGAFAVSLDLNLEERELALKFLKSKNWFVMPKVKISVVPKRRKHKKQNDANQVDGSPGTN